VSVEVTLSRINKKFEQEIKTNIENKIDEFFNLNNWEFGQDLKENDVVKALASVKQAEGFDIIFTTNEEENSGSLVTSRFFEIIRPATIEISFMYE
jgi:hypothetical protein